MGNSYLYGPEIQKNAPFWKLKSKSPNFNIFYFSGRTDLMHIMLICLILIPKLQSIIKKKNRYFLTRTEK